MASILFPGNNHGIQVVDNHGLITAEFYLPPERPETPPKPLSTVPFARDPDFVNCITLLNQIHEKSSVPGSRIALVGLGGVGKSQLAIEYTYRVQFESPAIWVFWLVENWLWDDNRGKWVCILDNVDDDKLLCSFLTISKRDPSKDLPDASNKPLLEYIPRSRNGSTIITGRTREVALKMVTHKDLIDVKPMERSEAVELFHRKLEQTEES
ncbi:hypothetical protein N7488_012016 [Penicillium malachiteum]|nr:hypothetical protein N7488_012016 [Penicillium malachiteum]